MKLLLRSGSMYLFFGQPSDQTGSLSESSNIGINKLIEFLYQLRKRFGRGRIRCRSDGCC